jgi:predicted ATPase/DNA-binding winged helix-turn-helix (wHTH) protein
MIIEEDGSKRRDWRIANGDRIFRVFRDRRQLLNGDAEIKLKPRPFDLLIHMIENAGRIISKAELMETVWKDCGATEAAISTQVSILRGIFGDRCVKAVNGKGYQFTLEVEPLDMPLTAPLLRQTAVTLPLLPDAGIGRASELVELTALSAEHRLTTIVGPGGVGKTWLAIRLGRQSVDRFPDGVHLVDLGPVTERLAVAGTLARVLGVALRRDDDPTRLLAMVIGERRMLLIFDSCEYVLEAARDLVKGLLALAPNLSVLATSQEPLGLPKEAALPLDPLPQADAEALFLHCVQAVGRRPPQNERTAAIVTEICRRLDGIPLALELAAAQVPAFGIEGLREGLDQQRFDMLGLNKRVGEARQATLTAMVEWSRGLLEEADQAVFRRLGRFRGGFTRDAAVAVAGETDADHWKIAASLGRLVAKSLLVADGDERPRYRLLETLRLYAAARLAESGEGESIAERHARFYEDLAERADLAWETTPDAAWLSIYGPEIDNLRTALDWTLAAPKRLPRAMALAGAAGHLWDRLGLAVEGREYLDHLVGRIGPKTPAATAARVLRRAGVLWRRTDRQRAIALLERSAALYRQTTDRLTLGTVLAALGGDYAYLGRHDEAKEMLDEAHELLTASDRCKSLWNVTNELGTHARLTDLLDQAINCFNIARDLARKIKDPLREGLTICNIAEVEFRANAIDRAIAHAEESAAIIRSAGEIAYLGLPLVNLASYLAVENRHDEERDCAAEALSLVRTEGGHWLRLCLQLWSLLGAQDGRYVDAAKLLGFVEAGYAASGELLEPTEQRVRTEILHRLTAQLSANDIKAWADEGARWDAEYAVAFTLDRLVSPGN